MSAPVSNVRPKPDKVLADIADYVSKPEVGSAEAYATARLCLMDTLGCGLEALEYPACTKLLGPLVPDTAVARGARVPGTRFELDPVQAAFNLGTMIRIERSLADSSRHVEYRWPPNKGANDPTGEFPASPTADNPLLGVECRD